MDNPNDDMIPEWQAKKETPPPAPPLQPAEPVYGMSPPDEAQAAQRTNSGLGIASFVMGLVGLLISGGSIAFIVSVILNNKDFISNLENTRDFQNSELMSQLSAGGLGILFSGFIMFVGFILGIVGLFQKNRKKGLAIAGTVLNGLVVALVVLLVIIGLVRYASANV